MSASPDLEVIRLPSSRPISCMTSDLDLHWPKGLLLMDSPTNEMYRLPRRLPITVIACILSITRAVFADESVDYLRDVKPILREKCFTCHAALGQKADLRVDTAELLIRGGVSGAGLVPGDADKSLLIKRVTELDPSARMPLDGKPLTNREIIALRTWINRGAPAPKDELPEDSPRQHWAFQTLERPPVSRADEAFEFAGHAATNPIDVFIHAEHRRHGVMPVRPAEKHVLLRRVSLDLVGLTPTRDHLHRFVADTSADAYERLVDQLLTSPHYGERWGRHWMDVWRYSDAYGTLGQRSQKHIWHWRDWIIESLNEDKHYDRMIVEMLAADEAAPMDQAALRATGFVARNYFHFDRNRWLDNTVEHMSKAFLGLTLNCCRCHDHKYDPLLQRDYYAMRGVFEPHRVRIDRLPGELDVKKGIPRVFDADPDVPTWLYVGGNEKTPDMKAPIPAATPAYFNFASLAIEPVRLPGPAYYPALRSFVIDKQLSAVHRAVIEAQAKASDEPTTLTKKRLQHAQLTLEALEARIAAEQARHGNRKLSDSEVLSEAAITAEQASVRALAELEFLEAEQSLKAARATLASGKENARASVITAESRLAETWDRLDDIERNSSVPDETSADQTRIGATSNGESRRYSNLGKIAPAVSSGRRLALARWITHPRNPLTARVAVNHVWLRHFGEPLVPTVFDFGRNGQPPTHPELLDWLAIEFIEHGWSMKWLHRVIVTSHAYQRSSSSKMAGADTVAKDPNNRWLWRANPRRMESQIIRDNVLYIAGRLDRKMGGAEIAPNEAAAITRRSVYFHHSDKERAQFFTVFDDANVNECYRRAETVVPQQALAMANSGLVLARSKQLAETLSSRLNQHTADDEFISAAFQCILSRSPTEAERVACISSLAHMRRSLTEQAQDDPTQRAREYLVHVLFNHNDFVTIR